MIRPCNTGITFFFIEENHIYCKDLDIQCLFKTKGINLGYISSSKNIRKALIAVVCIQYIDKLMQYYVVFPNNEFVFSKGASLNSVAHGDASAGLCIMAEADEATSIYQYPLFNHFSSHALSE